ncbi:MAG: hypothetical protein LBQ57_03170 [Spirochaetales bacterium]|jgi:hypothetical protein|nr:hypothetical protein [Spirochaetales bacterium]
MVRIARKIDPKRIAELKKKIHDSRYLQTAIMRIAQTLTNELVQRNDPRP